MGIIAEVATILPSKSFFKKIDLSSRGARDEGQTLNIESKVW
jgi:hypothetical protein